MNGTTVILLLAAAWVLQLGLSLWQTRRFYRRLSILRRAGRTAVGMEGSIYRRRAYAVLVVDERDRIVHAEQLSGWTVFARLRPVPQLVGLDVHALLMEDPQMPGVSRKILKAFRSAAQELTAEEQGADPMEGEASATAP